jgi:DNA-binding GntR family transcriptional regulator
VTAAEQVAGALRERILDGGLAPGARLVEQALAAEHDVARHTVRAALRVLAEEGLVRIEPHRGARVAALGPDDVLALYELRAALEVEAAHLALHRHGGRLPPAVHDACAALARAGRATRPRWPALSAAHGALHTAIVRAARSPRIAAAHARLDAETRLFLLGIRPHVAPRELADDHERLVAGLEADGPDVLRAHLRASAALLVDELD